MCVCAHHECMWEGRAALIFNLSTAWRSVSASCLQLPSLSGWAPGTHWIGHWVPYPQGMCAIFFWGINVMDFEKVTNCGPLEFWTALLMSPCHVSDVQLIIMHCIYLYSQQMWYIFNVSLRVWQVDHFHQDMACLQIADGGDSLQIWRVAAIILNMQSWIAHKGWSSSMGVGWKVHNPSL
jgi:hypothetical protein